MANEISNNARFGIHLGDGGNGRIGVVSSTQPYLKNTITGNGSTGIHVRGGSASIGGNDIIGNGTNPADSSRNGINVTGGHAYLPGGNTISGHPTFGVVVSAAGNALIGDGNLGAGISSVNTISGNGTNGALSPGSRGGILVFRGGAASLVNADVSGNSGTGVIALLNSSLEVSSSTVKTSSGDGIWLSAHSYMRMRNPSAVDGSGGSGIRLSRDAGAEFFGYVGAPPRVTNNAQGLTCEDAESSVWAEGNDFNFVSGNTAQNGLGNCTGF